jgi:hypothetical protein
VDLNVELTLTDVVDVDLFINLFLVLDFVIVDLVVVDFDVVAF